MSPTSYQAAPPRVTFYMLLYHLRGGDVKALAEMNVAQFAGSGFPQVKMDSVQTGGAAIPRGR